jgi:hypothetical protein
MGDVLYEHQNARRNHPFYVAASAITSASKLGLFPPFEQSHGLHLRPIRSAATILQAGLTTIYVITRLADSLVVCTLWVIGGPRWSTRVLSGVDQSYYSNQDDDVDVIYTT